MPIPGYDGAGHYTRNYSWIADDNASIGIASDRHDTEDNEFARALNVAFCRDGQAPATGSWNMANYKITGLGAATADNDAVSLAQLTGSGASPTPDIKKALNLTGADANGRLNFMSATGVNGIGWFGADLGWFARIDQPSKARPQLVLNTLWNGGLTATPGTDVISMNDGGDIRCTSLVSNLSLDSSGVWRTISPGYGTRLALNNTTLILQSIDAATATDPYVATTLQNRIEMTAYNGNATITLRKKDGTASGGTNVIYGTTGAAVRWVMQLGTTHAEDASNDGTHFYLTSCNNAGTSNYTVMWASRKDGKVTFPQGLGGVLNVDEYINSANVLVLGGNGAIYLRPNGYASTAGEAILNNAGDLTLGRFLYTDGIAERNGISGGPGSSFINLNYVPGLQAWVDDTNLGTISITCDYRIKKDVRPLASTWDKVKALRPVSYTPREFFDGRTMLSLDSDEERWGFLAHELQESLLPSAAEGAKDEQHRLQSPNLMAVIAALTAALQEAQLRIEALEARLAA